MSRSHSRCFVRPLVLFVATILRHHIIRTKGPRHIASAINVIDWYHIRSDNSLQPIGGDIFSGCIVWLSSCPQTGRKIAAKFTSFLFPRSTAS
ncbi:hypothetical protein M413DRAFT_298158 [Hebeloma cylindrosporum]|uniref:Uncharacterized protein n=1 Tax=Hebeloma cylindrosporum TaxID=76867 RepID=A0A0C3CAT9_HEBCY|nr:hypothetical protein M413DRAFT_298158 [Hebeloma cylindrosporum h7]